MSYAGVARDPEWVAWAEQETIARLTQQLGESRAERKLRRAAAEAAAAEAAAAEAARVRAGSAADIETLALSDADAVEQVDHPHYTHVSALSEPPDRHGPEWHDWAEAQTVLRLQQPRRSRRGRPAPTPLVLDLTVEVVPSRTIRIHHDNLKAVGI